jgi:hypothetical protein
MAAGFFVIGMVPAIFRHASPGRMALTLSIFFAVTGLLVPNALRPLHRVWMLLGGILGWINSKIILSLIFYLIVTPVRCLMSLFGKDPMNRKLDPTRDSYRVVRTPREVSHMKHQF